MDTEAEMAAQQRDALLVLQSIARIRSDRPTERLRVSFAARPAVAAVARDEPEVDERPPRIVIEQGPERPSRVELSFDEPAAHEADPIAAQIAPEVRASRVVPRWASVCDQGAKKMASQQPIEGVLFIVEIVLVDVVPRVDEWIVPYHLAEEGETFFDAGSDGAARANAMERDVEASTAKLADEAPILPPLE